MQNLHEIINDQETADNAATADFVTGCIFNALETINETIRDKVKVQVQAYKSTFTKSGEYFNRKYVADVEQKIIEAFAKDFQELVNKFETDMLCESAQNLEYIKNTEDDGPAYEDGMPQAALGGQPFFKVL